MSLFRITLKNKKTSGGVPPLERLGGKEPTGLDDSGTFLPESFPVSYSGSYTKSRRLPFILSIAAGIFALCGTIAFRLGDSEFSEIDMICTILSFVMLAELLWRGVLLFKYKAVPACDELLLPVCTVVVPAFNEGKQVFLTLKSLAASSYPEEKLQLIAIDDGSVDDTWEWILRGKELLGERLITVRFPCNRGKRHALHAGFSRSRGEILVTVDSDSIVGADTLKNLVAPFAVDSKTGAVAGNLRVLNIDEGFIPKMLDVAFAYTCNFLRASQSVVKGVLCTPGALSAYRKDLVMKVLQEWLEQTFCGEPANIGEDRALTNLILREGHHVLFQQNAVVYTEAPVTYDKLCKMLLRWARGDLRENAALTRFAFSGFRDGSMLGIRINLITNWIATLLQVLILATPVMVMLYPVSFGVSIMLGVIIYSSLAAGVHARVSGSFSSLWGFVYGFYSIIPLSWIAPYALLTPHKSGWLTRQAKPALPVDRREQFQAGRNRFLQGAETID